VLLAAGCALAAACRSQATKPDELPFELRLEFAGETSVTEERLAELVRRELARVTARVPDKAAVDDAAFALELFYRARGHMEVRVEYEFEPAAGSSPALARFSIVEGPVVRVRELVLEGATAIDPERVRTFFGDAAKGGIYDREKLAAGLDLLREFYRERGHVRIAIEEPEVDFDRDSATVTLRIVLHEGPAFRVRAIEMRGGTAEMEQREAQLARQHTGQLYLPVFLSELEHTLVEEYRRRGHPDATVDVRPELDETTGDVRIAVQITPGERVIVAHFRIHNTAREGNARTRDAAILGVMGIERGSAYDSERVRKAFRELYATGLFESVQIGLEGTGTERTLVVELVEARSVEIRLEPGWGSYEGPRFLVGIEEKNFQGRGQVLSLEGTASLRAQALRLAWVDRDFFGTSFTSETTAFVEKREEPSFEYVRRGLGFFLRRDLGQDWSASSGYEYRPTNVTDDVTASTLDEDTSVAALSLALTLDDRDNPLVPTRGRQGRLRLEWADNGLGSDTEFLRTQLEYTRLFRLGDSGVLAASARTGLIAPIGNTDEIPVTERYFNGGESSVRSFREDELLPELHAGSTGDPRDGGEGATTLNLELRHLLTGNLAGALFFDWGNVAERVQDYLDFAGFRTGIGVGLRYLLPIGPVRLDLGVNPDPESDEDEAVLHFSVGFPF
jgi:outer membrane protein assembly complex protein YaeT